MLIDTYLQKMQWYVSISTVMYSTVHHMEEDFYVSTVFANCISYRIYKEYHV